MSAISTLSVPSVTPNLAELPEGPIAKQLFDAKSPLLQRLLSTTTLIDSLEQIKTAAQEKKIGKLIEEINEKAKKAIEEAQKIGQLENLLRKLLNVPEKVKFVSQKAFYTFLEKKTPALIQYADIVDRYHSDDSGTLCLKNTTTKAPLNLSQLVLAISKISREHMLNSLGSISTSGMVVENENSPFIAKLEKEKIHIFKIENIISEGMHGVVKKVWDVAQCKFAMIKLAITDTDNDEGHLASLEREISKLKAIHIIGANYPGIQKPPIATFDIPNLKIFGFANDLHISDLHTWLMQKNVSNAQRITCCKNILKIYEKVAQHGLWHGDLKPANILIDESGMPWIIDWAGCRIFSVNGQETYEGTFERTGAYVHPLDEKALKDAKIKQQAEKFKSLGKAQDLYAIGSIIFSVLSGATQNFELYYPYKLCKYQEFFFSKMPDIFSKFDKKPLQEKGYSQTLITLVESMVHHDYTQRPNLESLLKSWDTV